MTAAIDCCDAGVVSAIGAADIDRDGQIDVIVATKDRGIGWYRNNSGVFGDRNLVSDSVSEQAVWIDAADMDGDGDMDVVGASLETQELFWFRNLDGAGSFGPKQMATPTLIGGISVELADMDGDGDTDLVWSSVSQNAIAWNANDGSGAFGQPRLIAAGFPAAQDTLTADVNGDGRLDVVVASLDFLNPRVAWYENLGGQFFSTEKTVIADGNGVWAVDAGDIDGDGDLDLVTSLYDVLTGFQKITWSENTNGQGSFGPQQTVIDQARFAMDVRLADVDGDGHVDVVGVPLVGNGQPMVVSNSGGGSFAEPVSISAQGALKFALADIDGDGDMDLVTDSDQGVVWAIASESPPRRIGDSNGDGIFDSSDIVAVFIAGRYETQLPATFEQGDWNNDGIFSTADLVTAFTAGGYVSDARVAASAAVANPGVVNDLGWDAHVSGPRRALKVDALTSAELAAAVDWLFHDARLT